MFRTIGDRGDDDDDDGEGDLRRHRIAYSENGTAARLTFATHTHSTIAPPVTYDESARLKTPPTDTFLMRIATHTHARACASSHAVS